MQQRRTTRPSPLLFGAIMFLIAFVQFSIGPTVPSLAEHLSTPASGLGIAFTFQFAGAFLALIEGRAIIRRLGYGSSLFLFTLLFVICAALLPFGRAVWQVCSLLFFLGAASAHAQVTMFALVELLYGEASNRYQNWVGSAFALGAVIGPIVTGLTSERLGWGTVFWTGTLLGALILPWLVGSLRQFSIRGAERPEDAARAPLGLAFWALTLALVAYLAGESIVNSWLSTYLKEWLAASAEWQGISLSVFWIGIAVGRLITGRFSRHIALTHLVTSCGLLALICLGAAVQAGSVPTAMLLFGLAGVSLGGVTPSLITLLARQPQGAERLFLYFAMGQLGPILFPYAAGRLAAKGGFYYAMLLSLPALFAMVLLIRCFDRLNRRSSIA